MLIAALYDVHANLPALEAVLLEITSSKVDHIVIGGDVLPGPMPREAVARLADLQCPMKFIQGNGEVAVLDCVAGKTPRVPEQYQSTLRWVAEQIPADQEQWISSWPKTLRMSVSGLGEVLFCHATPRDENEIFIESTAEDVLLPIFVGAKADLVICGHTHIQFERTIGKTRVANAGSVGMPFGEPGADWLLLSTSGIEFRHTSYDLREAAEQVRRTHYPQSEEFAGRSILQPPSKEEMLKVFARAEIKA
jgi:diadenosine tetraphosphatase ApaH/serine/threonine PP2A family protein phosphatase